MPACGSKVQLDSGLSWYLSACVSSRTANPAMASLVDACQYSGTPADKTSTMEGMDGATAKGSFLQYIAQILEEYYC